MDNIFALTVEEVHHKLRLEEFLFRKLPRLSKMYLREIIQDGNCTVGGFSKDRGFKLRTGNRIEITLDVSTQTSMTPENIPLEILFEDEAIIVVNKAAGMLVHPTKGVRNGTLLNALAFHLNHTKPPESEDFVRAGLVHRLDRKTSGLLVVAKTQRAHSVLSRHFQRRMVEKKYYAAVAGIVGDESGTIRAPIGKNEAERFWHISDAGKPAESEFRVIERRGDSTLLEMKPITGRTNQLRLHCQHIGHPIIGDDLYGGREFPRLCLHACKLSFRHPDGGEPIVFETELPIDFIA